MKDGRKVDVLVCTFRRPGVQQTLESLDALRVPGGIDLRIVVIDNEVAPSAERLVRECAGTMRLPVLYVHAPARNISIARNAGLDAASAREADWVAFIDDDERVDADWLSELMRRADETGADAVFGPSLADYGSDAPDWMRRQDYHSNRPERRDGVVQTGHTCNALLRWHGTGWEDARFDLARGRSGGEDTEFFFRLYHLGGAFETCETAIVREGVEPGRLSFQWLWRRKFRSGQSYASIARSGKERARLALSAAGKVLACGGGAALNMMSEERRNYWLLRGALHAGVVAGVMSLRQAAIYGNES